VAAIARRTKKPTNTTAKITTPVMHHSCRARARETS
jgi:hypothetical protein